MAHASSPFVTVSSSVRHVFITGQPGAGKTTLFRRLCNEYSQRSNSVPCYGFYTEEIRNNGFRIGFDLVTLDGKSRTALARTDEFTRSNSSNLPRVGQYNVFVDEFERVVLSLFSNMQMPCLCFIDEIGKMELLSKKFKQIIQNLIDQSSVSLVATIPIKPVPFVDTIRARKDYHLITVTRENRTNSRLYSDALEMIEKLLTKPS